MANINKELNQIKNAVYGKDVRGSIHDGIEKINNESEDSKQKADEAHDVMESIINDGFDNAALESNFEQKLDDKIENLQPDWTQFKDQTNSQLADISINVVNFGAVGDGVHDDGPAIREAYNYLKSIGGGELYFPVPNNRYSIKSTHTHSTLSVGLIHDSDNISFKSPSDGVSIRADVEMHSMIYSPIRTNYTQFQNMLLQANELADYCFNTGEVYTPFLDVKNSRFYGAKEFAFRVNTYVATFSKSFFGQSKNGLRIEGVGQNIATSVTLDSCYAVQNELTGFSSKNLRYSTFNSCAVDNMEEGIAYDIEGRGISMNSCGAEKVRQIFRSASFRGFSINTFFAFDVGSLDPNNPTKYLFEFITGTDASFTGLNVHEGSERYYDHKVGLTQSNYGFENITIVDDSVRRNEVYFIPNHKFDRPIKFIRGDETTKDETITLDVGDFEDYLKEIQFMEINHNIIIQINDGRQENVASQGNLLLGFKGAGTLTIQGNVNDRTLVELHGSWNRLLTKNNDILIKFKDISFINYSSGGSVGFDLLQVINSRIILDNVFFNRNELNTSTGVRATNGSEVFVINGTTAGGGGQFIQNQYESDDTSVIHDKTT